MVNAEECHRSGISDHRAVLIKTQGDGRARALLVRKDHRVRVDTFGPKARQNEVAEQIAGKDTGEGDARTEDTQVAGNNSGAAAQGNGHLVGKNFLSDLGEPVDVVQNDVHIQFTGDQDVIWFVC